VVLGTDHHPFLRLVTWADDHQRRHTGDEVVVQHGYSPAPSGTEALSITSPAELDELMRSADVVITHGGPGTAMAARRAGHLPLVLARDPELGEHVDGHQMRFTAWASEKGLLRGVGGTAELDEVVESLDGQGTRREVDIADATPSVVRLVQLLGEFDRGRRSTEPGAPTIVLGDADAAEHVEGHLVGWLPALWSARTPGIVCTCGEDLAHCPFWSDVVERAFSDEGLPAERVRTLEAELLGARTPVVAGKRVAERPVREALLAYGAVHRALYAAVLDVTRAPAVIDLDPELRRAVALTYDSGLDVRVRPPEAAPREIRDALRRRRAPLVPGARSTATGSPPDDLPPGTHLLLPPEDHS
jgi:UDP-N-acetylglucosamine transferase subunit ALG13